MPDVQDARLKYGGKVLVIHIVLNTDQDPYRVAKALRRAARGPNLDALVMTTARYDGDEGAKVWAVVQETMVKVAAEPKATTFNDKEG